MSSLYDNSTVDPTTGLRELDQATTDRILSQPGFDDHQYIQQMYLEGLERIKRGTSKTITVESISEATIACLARYMERLPTYAQKIFAAPVSDPAAAQCVGFFRLKKFGKRQDVQKCLLFLQAAAADILDNSGYIGLQTDVNIVRPDKKGIVMVMIVLSKELRPETNDRDD